MRAAGRANRSLRRNLFEGEVSRSDGHCPAPAAAPLGSARLGSARPPRLRRSGSGPRARSARCPPAPSLSLPHARARPPPPRAVTAPQRLRTTLPRTGGEAPGNLIAARIGGGPLPIPPPRAEGANQGWAVREAAGGVPRPRA